VIKKILTVTLLLLMFSNFYTVFPLDFILMDQPSIFYTYKDFKSGFFFIIFDKVEEVWFSVFDPLFLLNNYTLIKESLHEKLFYNLYGLNYTLFLRINEEIQNLLSLLDDLKFSLNYKLSTLSSIDKLKNTITEINNTSVPILVITLDIIKNLSYLFDLLEKLNSFLVKLNYLNSSSLSIINYYYNTLNDYYNLEYMKYYNYVLNKFNEISFINNYKNILREFIVNVNSLNFLKKITNITESNNYIASVYSYFNEGKNSILEKVKVFYIHYNKSINNIINNYQVYTNSSFILRIDLKINPNYEIVKDEFKLNFTSFIMLKFYFGFYKDKNISSINYILQNKHLLNYSNFYFNNYPILPSKIFLYTIKNETLNVSYLFTNYTSFLYFPNLMFNSKEKINPFINLVLKDNLANLYILIPYKGEKEFMINIIFGLKGIKTEFYDKNLIFPLLFGDEFIIKKEEIEKPPEFSSFYILIFIVIISVVLLFYIKKTKKFKFLVLL